MVFAARMDLNSPSMYCGGTVQDGFASLDGLAPVPESVFSTCMYFVIVHVAWLSCLKREISDKDGSDRTSSSDEDSGGEWER